MAYGFLLYLYIEKKIYINIYNDLDITIRIAAICVVLP